MNDASRTHRTTIEIDVPAFEEAREALGTRGYKETVNQALRATGRMQLLHRGAAQIRSGSIGLISPEELRQQRRPRVD